MNIKKIKIAPREPYAHTVIYKIKINYDSKVNHYFAMFLLGDGVTKARGKFIRSWNRFFESDTLEGVLDNIKRNDDWKDATLPDYTPVTSEILIDMLDSAHLEDQFYSFFYLRPEYENKQNRDIVEVVLNQYNASKKLFTRKEQARVCYEEIFKELQNLFNAQQVENIKLYLFHIVKTDNKSLRNMEIK